MLFLGGLNFPVHLNSQLLSAKKNEHKSRMKDIPNESIEKEEDAVRAHTHTHNLCIVTGQYTIQRRSINCMNELFLR